MQKSIKSDSLCLISLFSYNCKFLRFPQDYCVLDDTFTDINFDDFFERVGGLQWGFCTHITLEGYIKSFAPLSNRSLNTSHWFFWKHCGLLKYASVSTVSFLGFSYAQSFVVTDLFNRIGGGVEEQVNFNWNCAWILNKIPPPFDQLPRD